MPEYNPFQIKNILKCEAAIVNHGEIHYLLTDSRRIINAEKSLFFAINGNHQNGHHYIEHVIAAGVKNVVIEKGQPVERNNSVNYFVVENAVQALQHLAGAHREKFKYPVIAITGSNGKTIVKEWVFQCLSEKYTIVRNPRSYNSQTGVPLSVWNMENEHGMAVFEAGISLTGEMKKLETILQPQIGIFTNIGDAHQENFRSLEEKALEKIQLFKNSRALIYCSDYPEIQKAVDTFINVEKTKLLSWSTNQKGYLNILDTNMNEGRTHIKYEFKHNQFSVEIPFTDKGSIENAIHVLCLLHFMELPFDYIKSHFKKLQSVEMRLQQKTGILGSTLINDSYNSDINSLSIALDYLQQQIQHNEKCLIISDLQQINKNEDDLYKKVAMLIKEKGINEVIGIGKSIRQYASYFAGKTSFYAGTDDFLNHFEFSQLRNKAILLKGARSFEFEKIEQHIENKVHRTILQVNMDAIIHNLNYFRSLIHKNTKVMAMVKALSYGSGTFEIAHLLKFHRIDYLGVAYVDEGIDLRKAGVNTPIMVMNPEVGNIDQMIDYRLEPEVYSFKILNALIEKLHTKGEMNYPCHIKLDTGMHRLGFMENETETFIEILKSNKIIYVKSLFSHLAGSDDDLFIETTHRQIEVFKHMGQKISQAIGYQPLQHILNSSGIARYPEAQFDMVRLGIGLYGFAGNSEKKLKNVFTLKTVISQIKEIKKGEGIGYNPKSRLQQDVTIAILAIGYADGFDRKLGNGIGKILIGKKLYPVIGNVCMDMIMIDITGSKGLSEGDEVIVFGDQYTAANQADQLDTIPYEIITSISARIKRVYYKE